MNNRRNSERHQLVFHARVRDADDKGVIGHLVDLSTDGVMIATEQALTVGQTCHLRIDLPLACNGLRALITHGTVAWSEPAAHPAYQLNGIRADSLDGQQRRALETLISGYRLG